ncbi:type VI secretion system protein TssA [Mesorhizobium sp. B2-3-12]|uniref:type VI secretion system protein TssA n=1 Tax=Mesorhizobium sp. B2-3-12 TaxID=2589952 RepID=UPI00112A4706|nr:type VI secretion system protein TssA [Mesorhizobium sp. B2-3-12]TPL88513.1 type VI secretion system protein TssA [Mesorhizobium sp. B2-3-12]
MIDLALWLNPLDGHNPSGADLRNDPAFHELERLTEAQIKVVHEGGNNASQSTISVDWATVLQKAEELQSRGRDLRLLVIVTRALANEERLAGLAQGLNLIARTFDQYWDTMHPALRTAATPRDAALRRINALLDLQNGQEGLLANLRQTVFFSPRAIGPISGRDLEQAALDERVMLQEAASGLGAAERAALTSAHNQMLNRVRMGCAALADQSAEAIMTLLSDARAAISALEAVDTALNNRIDGNGAAVPELKKFLQRLLTTLEWNTSASATNGAAKPAAGPPKLAPTPTRNGHGAETMASTASSAETSIGLPELIASRDEVVQCLDLVVAFYDRTEPSSPIPHLARRVRRMVHMDFVELMEDLAPSGLKEFRLLAGVPDPKKPVQKDER